MQREVVCRACVQLLYFQKRGFTASIGIQDTGKPGLWWMHVPVKDKPDVIDG